MKLPCYLVQDLLPLYKDHVCDEHRKKESARPAGKNHAGRCGRTAGPDLCFLWLALLDDALLCGPAGRRSCSRRDP